MSNQQPAPEHYYSMFRQEIRNVWKNTDQAINLNNIQIFIRENNDGAVMSIRAGHTDYRTKAIGRIMRYKIGFKKPIILYISPRALQLSEQDFRALMRHEALHIGYPRHDKNFKYLVKEIHAPLTEYEQDHPNENPIYTVLYQPKGIDGRPKKGARFKKLKDFDDKDEAFAFSNNYAYKNIVKTRVQWRS